MNFFDSVKNSISGHFDKKKEDKEWLEKLNREALQEERKVFEEQFRINAKEVARSKAYKDAAEKSGLQKLRAMNRARNLNNDDVAPGSFFSKLSTYTQKNIANREKNLEKTEMMRGEAQKMRQEAATQRTQERTQRLGERKANFGKSTWRM